MTCTGYHPPHNIVLANGQPASVMCADCMAPIPAADGVVVPSVAQPRAGASGEREAAWRAGWAECKASLTDDEAFCLTDDVERDAWLDSATARLTRSEADEAISGLEPVAGHQPGCGKHDDYRCDCSAQSEADEAPEQCNCGLAKYAAGDHHEFCMFKATGADEAPGVEIPAGMARAYFERGFIASYAWSVTKAADAKLSDDVIDHAWAHRDEGMDPEDLLPPIAQPVAPSREAVAREADTALAVLLEQALVERNVDRFKTVAFVNRHTITAALTPDAAKSDAVAERLSDILDTERYKVAIAVQAIKAAIGGRQWLAEPGRGSYTYDDERYQAEFGAALAEIDTALAPLRKIASDWSDCPRDPLRVAANRSAALATPTAPSDQGTSDA